MKTNISILCKAAFNLHLHPNIWSKQYLTLTLIEAAGFPASVSTVSCPQRDPTAMEGKLTVLSAWTFYKNKPLSLSLIGKKWGLKIVLSRWPGKTVADIALIVEGHREFFMFNHKGYFLPSMSLNSSSELVFAVVQPTAQRPAQRLLWNEDWLKYNINYEFESEYKVKLWR